VVRPRPLAMNALLEDPSHHIVTNAQLPCRFVLVLETCSILLRACIHIYLPCVCLFYPSVYHMCLSALSSFSRLHSHICTVCLFGWIVWNELSRQGNHFEATQRSRLSVMPKYRKHQFIAFCLMWGSLPYGDSCSIPIMCNCWKAAGSIPMSAFSRVRDKRACRCCSRDSCATDHLSCCFVLLVGVLVFG